MKFTTPVIKGQGRGKTLGFPTFNLRLPAGLDTKPGIYAGWVWIKAKQYPGAFHYGPIPVFNQPQLHLEVFVLDYESDAPIISLTFELIHYLRPIRNFAIPEKLKLQISQDVKHTRQLLNQSHLPR